MIDNNLFGIEVQSFDSVDKFLDYMNPNKPHWSLPNDAVWIHRGQSNADWDLQPSAWRSGKNDQLRLFEQKFEKFRPALLGIFGDKSGNPDRAIELTLKIATEYEVVHSFIELADELGFAIPRKGYDSEWSGRQYLERVLTQKHFVSFVFPLYFTLAQHHGIPTRLLDFSRNILKAVFFATESTENSRNPEQIAVWSIDVSKRDGGTFPDPYVTVTCPRHSHSFIHSQDGLFLMAEYPSADSYYLKNGFWPNNLDELRTNTKDDFVRIRKTTLPYALVPELRDNLWRLRISRAHLMPTLNHVKEAVFWRSKSSVV